MQTRLTLLEHDADEAERIGRRVDRLVYAAVTASVAFIFDAVIQVATRAH